MDAAVDDDAWLAALLRFEAELARAHGALGRVPTETAEAIAAVCDPQRFDVAAIGRAAVASASPVVPLVEAIKAGAGGAATYVHKEATSQDALDTAMMLVARDGIAVILDELDALAERCAVLADRHRDDRMAGRTLLRRARPITFGAKAARWRDAVAAARARLAAIESELPVQLGGPVGTLEDPELVAALARNLDLKPPPRSWHTDRGRIAELGAALAIAAGAAAKIALDVLLLAQDEVGEVAEAAPGGSSAMPGKRNAAHAVAARAAYLQAVADASLLLGALAGEHERAAGAWQAEWPALSAAFRHAAGAVARTKEAITDLQVDTRRMRLNLGDEQDG